MLLAYLYTQRVLQFFFIEEHILKYFYIHGNAFKEYDHEYIQSEHV